MCSFRVKKVKPRWKILCSRSTELNYNAGRLIGSWILVIRYSWYSNRKQKPLVNVIKNWPLYIVSGQKFGIWNTLIISGVWNSWNNLSNLWIERNTSHEIGKNFETSVPPNKSAFKFIGKKLWVKSTTNQEPKKLTWPINFYVPREAMDTLMFVNNATTISFLCLPTLFRFNNWIQIGRDSNPQPSYREPSLLSVRTLDYLLCYISIICGFKSQSKVK